MKNIIVATVVLCMGMMLFISMKGDKEPLADIIAKQETILVAVDKSSKIVRNPAIGESKYNVEQIPSDMIDKFMTTIIETLNKGFKTEAFQYYRGETVDKKKMEEKGFNFFVIVSLSGRYTMSEAVNSNNMYTYRYHMNIDENFYGLNAKGKFKVMSSGPSINSDCSTFTSPIKSIKLMRMMINCMPQCIEYKLLEQILKKNKKFTEKQLAKAAK